MHSSAAFLLLLALGAASSPLPSTRSTFLGNPREDVGSTPTLDAPASAVSRAPSRIYPRYGMFPPGALKSEDFNYHLSPKPSVPHTRRDLGDTTDPRSDVSTEVPSVIPDPPPQSSNFVILHGEARGRRVAGLKRDLRDAVRNSRGSEPHLHERRRDPLSGPLTLPHSKPHSTSSAVLSSRELEVETASVDVRPRPRPLIELRAPAPQDNLLENISNGNSYSGAAGSAVGGSVGSLTPLGGSRAGLLGGTNLISLFSGNAGNGGQASSGTAGLAALVNSAKANGVVKKIKGKNGSKNVVSGITSGTVNENIGNAFSGAAGNASGGNVVKAGTSLIELFSNNAGNAGQANSGGSNALPLKLKRTTPPAPELVESALTHPDTNTDIDVDRLVPSSPSDQSHPPALEAREPAPQKNPINPYPMDSSSSLSASSTSDPTSTITPPTASPSPSSLRGRALLKGRRVRKPRAPSTKAKRGNSFGTRPRPDLSKIRTRLPRFESAWARKVELAALAAGLSRDGGVGAGDPEFVQHESASVAAPNMSTLSGCWEWVRGLVRGNKQTKMFIASPLSRLSVSHSVSKPEAVDASSSRFLPIAFPFFRPGAGGVGLGPGSGGEKEEVVILPIPAPPAPSVSVLPVPAPELAAVHHDVPLSNNNGQDSVDDCSTSHTSNPQSSPHDHPHRVGAGFGESGNEDVLLLHSPLAHSERPLPIPPCECWSIWPCSCETSPPIVDPLPESPPSSATHSVAPSRVWGGKRLRFGASAGNTGGRVKYNASGKPNAVVSGFMKWRDDVKGELKSIGLWF